MVNPGAPRKLVCLESYWGEHHQRLFQNTSVRPFLEALGSQLYPPLRIAHRFVESGAQLARYVAGPDGLLWRDREVFDAPVFYLSFHGSPGALRSSLDRVEADALCRAFAGWGEKYPNLIYFGACSVFAGRAGQQFARAFLAASGCRAILGYATDMDWMDSMLTDLLFLRRFYRDSEPWQNLRRIHQSVLGDFAPARRLKFQLHAAKEPA